MHPEVQQDEPGKCPKCGMDLVPKTEHGEHEHEEHGAMPQMTRDMRRHWLWTNFTIIALALWLISSPFTFGYANGRLAWSDAISGVLLAAFAAIAFWPRMDFWGRWGIAFVGAWLQFAPLLFWASNPAAYANDTIVGAFAIALSILVPMMPGMAHHMAMMKPGPEIPPGWTYNPSTWHQRAPLIALALIGWFISRHLAAVQLGYIPAAWEPFFGQGTHLVLHSKVSQMWPISDAGLGACAYTFEFLMGWMGGQTRWRSMPWMVLFFGILIVPLGIVSIVLVILQPVVVGHWCTLCLATATVMLVMIPLMLDEVFAMVQFMVLAKREGKPLWRTFWVGDTIQGGEKDNRTPRYGSPILPMAPAMVWGVTMPWNLLASAVLGVWLMFAPSVFGTRGAAADSDHLIGALAVTIAVIAMAEVVRAGRFLNVLLGLWIIASPWLLAGTTSSAKWNDVIAGAVLVVLSLPRGAVRERYGNWNRCIR
jgi:hypothetical protein